MLVGIGMSDDLRAVAPQLRSSLEVPSYHLRSYVKLRGDGDITQAEQKVEMNDSASSHQFVTLPSAVWSQMQQ